MKRIITLIITLALILGIMIPGTSMAESKPKTPAIKSTSSTASSITVSWNNVGGAVGYQVAFGKKNTPDFSDTVATVYGTGCTISGLKADTSYAVRVRAFYKSGTKMKYTSWSGKKYVTTKKNTPDKPVISSLSYSGGAVTVKWNKDSRAKGYEVSWSEKGPSPWGSPKDVKSTGSYTATSRIITGTTMAFRVRAYWYEGTKLKYTSWSETKYVKTTSSGTGSSKAAWSDWSSWSEKKVTAGPAVQVETRHHWWAAKCKSCGTHNPYWGDNRSCIHCGKKMSKSNTTHVNVYTTSKGTLTKLNGRNDGRKLDGKAYWYCEIQYRCRTMK